MPRLNYIFLSRLLIFVCIFAIFQWSGLVFWKFRHSKSIDLCDTMKKSELDNSASVKTNTYHRKNCKDDQDYDITSDSAPIKTCRKCSYDWLNFTATPCRGACDPLKCSSDILSKSWKADQRKKQVIRNLLESAISSNPNAILTKNNTRPDDRLKLVYEPGRGNVTKEMYNSFIEHFPFTKLFHSCAVVGSSGLILNSHCGSTIDKSQFVFRSNFPPLKRFSRDAGTKSSLTTMNPISILRNRYASFRLKENKTQFFRDLKEFTGYFWLPVFSGSKPLRYMTNLIKKHIKTIERRGELKIIIQNPEHMIQMGNFFGKFANLERKLSTGFYLAVWAITLCEETTLYGYWPFSYTEYSKPIPYHYYDKLNFTAALATHSMDKEFSLLLKWHQEGIIKVHHGACNHN